MKFTNSIPEGFKEVAQEEMASVLSSTGNRGLGYFFAGDEIIVPEEPIVCVKEPDEQSQSDSSSKRSPIPYIGVFVNSVARWVPFASFRRWPSKDSAGFAERTPLMKSLFVGSDADRLQILAGKTIQVTEMAEGDTRDWTACPPGFTGDLVYRKTKFPVLAEKQA